MADQVIKKARIKQADLPPVNTITEGYSIRYRIISEDKNRTSHWSPVYLVKPQFTFVPKSIGVSKQGSIANVVWDAVTINKVVSGKTNLIKKATEYDIWAKWGKSGAGDWTYMERAQATSVSFVVPETYFIDGVDQNESPNELSVEIYLKGSPLVRGDGVPLAPGTPFLKVYQKLLVTV